MQTALIFLLVSVVVLIVIVGIFRVEDARDGNRIILKRIRSLFDRFFIHVSKKLSKVDTYLGRGLVRLMVHYVFHGVLHKLLMSTKRLEQKIENLLRRNKQIVKAIRSDKEKTHLDKIAEHKEQVALTEEQKMKMRSHD